MALTSDMPMDRKKITRWITDITQKQGQNILRAKGIIDIAGNDRRLVFQAVHMILEGDLQRRWKPDEKRYSRIVFIGRELDAAALKTSFEACTATRGETVKA